MAELFADIKDRRSHPGVASYYRGLANWPEFLSCLLTLLAPFAGSDDYRRARHALIETAGSLSEDFLVMVGPDRELTSSISGSDAPVMNAAKREEIRPVVAVFRLKLIPDLLDTYLVKAMFGGSQAASRSRFSVASRDPP